MPGILVAQAALVAAPLLAASLHPSPPAGLVPPEPCLVGLVTAATTTVPGACAVEDADFLTDAGGCKDVATGLVWSVTSVHYYLEGTIESSFFIWEDAISFCADLVEGGYDDWTLPTIEQAEEVVQNGSPDHFNFYGAQFGTLWWTATPQGQRAWFIKYGDPEDYSGVALKPSKLACLCVRDPGAAPPPAIAVDAVVPNQVTAGGSVSVTIVGGPFAPGAHVTFESGSGGAPSATGVTVLDASTIAGTVSAPGGGKPGVRLWDLRITNPDGGTGVLVEGFAVVK